MEKLEMLYEGKAKKVFKTEKADEYIIEYKDDATAFNGKKKDTIANKGIVNNKFTGIIFGMLEEAGVPTHLIKVLDDTHQLVKAVEIVPVEVIIRNVAAGSICKNLGLEEGKELNPTVFEFCYKNDDFDDPLINDYHVLAMGLATQEEIDTIKEYTFKINELLKDFFLKHNLKLIDFKIEFGRCNGKIVLADEISPDTCRLWDKDTNRKMDKDRFRRDLGDVEETYKEVLGRISE
ncbi:MULTISPECIES: phosphoribosylaminoimidazolesuccinocarboxamide synthase [Anaerofustis]|uniref:phosphoribosylaminoimidazolesuccinocarboxamide synthase n=1 Tax=Anaerofustis TaxID=264995 RepID=UPI0011066C51|nr:MULTISPECIES: phosphoribosylaminoimidazolesuccinocarboxamide synthase [Anaerofustis]MCO8194130.1 phosphoribosylaminoimidazolesuccinocarboxamide synthase [Anaerofustis sp. NSJ-163]